VKISFCADIHIANHQRMGGPVLSGLNRRCALALRVFKDAVQGSQTDLMVVLGDLVDTTRPEPQVLTGIQEAIGSKRVVLLMGNHDQVSTKPGDHALGPLAPVANVIERPTVLAFPGGALFCVPFRPGRARDWLPEVVATLAPEKTAGGKVLLLHLGLMGDDVPAYLKDAHDAVPASLVKELCEQHGMDAAFAGNWHGYREFPGNVFQCGTLCPTGFDNPGLEGYGQVLTWDFATKTMSRVEVEGPRFLKLKTKRLPLHMALPPGDLYVQIMAEAEQVAGAKAWLDTARDAGLVLDGEVVLDDVEVKVAARTAATVARSAKTLDEAVAGFVAQMPMPDGVDREAVLARVKGYLGGAE